MPVLSSAAIQRRAPGGLNARACRLKLELRRMGLRCALFHLQESRLLWAKFSTLLLCSLCPCLASLVPPPRQAMLVKAEAAVCVHEQRAYLGPTSMDTEMAFIMCNLGQVWAFSMPSGPGTYSHHT